MIKCVVHEDVICSDLLFSTCLLRFATSFVRGTILLGDFQCTYIGDEQTICEAMYGDITAEEVGQKGQAQDMK